MAFLSFYTHHSGCQGSNDNLFSTANRICRCFTVSIPKVYKSWENHKWTGWATHSSSNLNASYSYVHIIQCFQCLIKFIVTFTLIQKQKQFSKHVPCGHKMRLWIMRCYLRPLALPQTRGQRCLLLQLQLPLQPGVERTWPWNEWNEGFLWFSQVILVKRTWYNATNQ